jgi:hypothetical protein
LVLLAAHRAARRMTLARVIAGNRIIAQAAPERARNRRSDGLAIDNPPAFR